MLLDFNADPRPPRLALPVGVGIGFKPPKYLKRGDIVAITIEPIGTLSNPVS